MNLYHALLDYDLVLLAAIAERRGTELTARRQQDAAEELATALLEPESMQEVVAWLTPNQRAALDALLVAGGQLPATRFSRDHGAVRRMGPGRLEREKPWRDPQSSVEALYYAGLIFFGFDKIEGQIVEIAFVPDDLLPFLPAVESGLGDLAVAIVSPPRIVRDAGRAVAEDLTTLLGWIDTDSPRPGPDRALRPRDMARINERLMVSQDLTGIRSEHQAGRLGLLLHLTRELQLVEVLDGRLHLQRPTTRKWLQADPFSQMLTLQVTWRDDPQWNDLWQVPSLRPERTGWRNDPLATRVRLLKHLACCSADQWISLERFIAAIKQTDPDFQRPADAYNAWYIRDVSTGEYLMGHEHWNEVEGALVAYLIAGPLHWMGVTTLGFESHEAAPVAFRLTPSGAFFLNLTDQAPQAPPPPPMTVEADLTVRTLAGGNLYDRFQLARVAEWQASGEVFVYQITPASLSRALSQDIRVEHIVAFLKRTTRAHLPSKAVETLRAWSDRRGEVRLARATVLETRTATVMRELRAHPAIGPLLGESLSPTRVLVMEQDQGKLMPLLQQIGYWPSKEKK
jgi:hypothetical protein